MELRLQNVTYRYPGGNLVLGGISAAAATGELIAIVGPNGAGKSTLLDVLAGQRPPATGHYWVDGHPANSYSSAALCRKVAHLPQQLPHDVPFAVEDVVLTGRIPYGAGLYESAADLAALEAALAATGLLTMRQRPFASLSGGERQRVLLAAALCQQADALLLDEPSAHLDPEHQAGLWELLKQLRNAGRLIVIITHHLSLAAQCADRVWLLHQGLLVADGVPAAVMQPAQLAAVFRVPFYSHANGAGKVLLSYGW